MLGSGRGHGPQISISITGIGGGAVMPWPAGPSAREQSHWPRLADPAAKGTSA
jgi:hypothetical protein